MAVTQNLNLPKVNPRFHLKTTKVCAATFNDCLACVLLNMKDGLCDLMK